MKESLESHLLVPEPLLMDTCQLENHYLCPVPNTQQQRHVTYTGRIWRDAWPKEGEKEEMKCLKAMLIFSFERKLKMFFRKFTRQCPFFCFQADDILEKYDSTFDMQMFS